MNTTSLLAVSVVLFLGFQFADTRSASAQTYDCLYRDDEARSIELDIDRRTYWYNVLSGGEENHFGGSLVSESNFIEDKGAVAVLQHVTGMRQGDQVTELDQPYFVTFQMERDGKFVEVSRGEIKAGTCAKQQNDAGARSVADDAPLSGDRFSQPWDNPATAIVLDVFRGNSIDWEKIKTDTRVAGIIHKASEGLRTDSKYKERKEAAVANDYAWGSYHLLTTADATRQVDHYLSIVGNDPRESRAVDIECLSGSGTCQNDAFKVTVTSIETALRRLKEKTGHFPLLYVNHAVASTLSQRWKETREFSEVRLWYARFKNKVSDFPKSHWDGYTLWQFSSEINCSPSVCLYRVPGTKYDMDLNVYFGTPQQLKKAWPLER